MKWFKGKKIKVITELTEKDTLIVRYPIEGDVVQMQAVANHLKDSILRKEKIIWIPKELEFEILRDSRCFDLWRAIKKMQSGEKS